MVIAFDLDGVVVDFVGTANTWLAEALGRHPVAVTEWDWQRAYGTGDLVESTWTRMWHEFNYGDLYAACQPIAGAIEALHLLRALRYRFLYVTNRHPASSMATHAWLRRYDIWAEILFKSRKPYDIADLYFDDKPKHFLRYLEAGKPAFLFDQPWNRSLVTPYRVKDWCHVVDIIRYPHQHLGAVE